MKKKSLKACLQKALINSKSDTNKNHFEVIKPIIDNAMNLVRVEEIDDDAIIELENDIIMDYFNKIMEERKVRIDKLVDKKKMKQAEIDSNELAIIGYYFRDCCNKISY